MSGLLVTIAPDGVTVELRITKKRGNPSLEALQAIVGGYIERVRVRYDGRVRDAYVNENGVAERLAFNPFATQLLAPPFQGQSLVGPCAIWVPDPKGKKWDVDPAGDNSIEGGHCVILAGDERTMPGTFGEVRGPEATASQGAIIKQLADALTAAYQHLEYCDYGDKWECEYAHDAGLPAQIEAALAAAGVKEPLQ